MLSNWFFFFTYLKKNSTVHIARLNGHAIEDSTPTGFAYPVTQAKFLLQSRNFVGFDPLPNAYRGPENTLLLKVFFFIFLT